MLIPVRKQLQIQRSPDLDSYNVGKIIVCSPLIALMQDQVDRLNSIPNVKAVYKGESKDSDQIIAEGKFDYLIASPEVLVGNSGFRHILQEFKVDTIVVDECHTMCTWGGLGDEEQLAFRKWFRHLGELRSMFPSANLLAVSATCNKTIRRTVMKELGLQKECTTLIIRSPDKSNIKYYVKKIDSSIEMSMQFLLDSLELEAFPRTIIYATSVKEVSELYNYLCNENPTLIDKVDMFHSETSDEKKSDIIKNLQDGDSQIKLVIATSALGMGIDIVNCHSVILYGIPSTTTDLIQEVGRIGRDGKESIALLLYNKYHLQHADISVKHIYKTQTCRRISIMKDFLSTSQLDSLKTGIHSCCDICELECSCKNCKQLPLQQYFLGPCVMEDSDSVSSDATDIE
ncbi:ATP-dependent DNA helicase RecQ-like [Saccostrea cucullata]|uniref:ATP-dependent DNA helicase RecQ-like n=1 Tax=Saccostrea cuccullata TaxID=36930 RepID=UPI002ED60CA6